jgi:lysophospholipase L1-like esterase
MAKCKICIIGNSVALRNRPVEVYPKNKNYGTLLDNLLSEEQDVCLVNRAFGRATIIDISQHLDDYICEFPDYYILNIGVCDATSRPVSRIYGNIINSKKAGCLKAILSSIYYRLIKPHSSFFVRLRRKKAWLTAKRFKNEYENILSELSKDTNARIILMSINKGNDRLESLAPGSSKKYLEYNTIIKDIADKYSQIYLDTTDMRDTESYPDGVHFNIKGNRDIANRLYKLIRAGV